MTPEEIVAQVRDAMTVRRVFGDPIERNGLVVVPVAHLQGGGGGGRGRAAGEPAAGWGGGWGMRARPAGVFVIRGDRVTWQPAVDVTRVALGGQVLAAIGFVLLASVLRRRRRRG